MLALIGNLQFSELAIIAIIAILIFGRRLPQVAGQAAAHVGRMRKTLEGLWRETGIEDEVRSVRREIDRFERQLPRQVTPRELARKATQKIWEDVAGDPEEAGEAGDDRAQTTPPKNGAEVDTPTDPGPAPVPRSGQIASVPSEDVGAANEDHASERSAPAREQGASEEAPSKSRES